MGTNLTWGDVQEAFMRMKEQGALLPDDGWHILVHPAFYDEVQQTIRRLERRKAAYLRRYHKQGERNRKGKRA